MSKGRPSGPTAPFGHLEQTMPWPLEQLIRQYLGFNQCVVKQYNDLVEYYDNDCLRDKTCLWVIAQWRGLEHITDFNLYICQFRFIFNHNHNENTRHFLRDRISEPRRLYKDIVKLGVPVGRVI